MPSNKGSKSFATQERRPASEYIDGEIDRWDTESRKRNVPSRLMAQLEECREAIAGIEKGFREELCDNLQRAFLLAKGFADRSEDWDEFCDDDFWIGCKMKRPKPADDHPAIIAWVVRYLYRIQSTEGARYSRAYKYWRTLQGYLRDKVPADEISDRLLEEGPEYAFNTEARDHPRDSRREGNEDEAAPSELEPSETKRMKGDRVHGSTADPEYEELGHAKLDFSPSRKSVRSKSSLASSDTTGASNLTIEVSAEELVIALASKVGDRRTVEYEHVETLDSGWKRFVATTLQIL